MLKGRQVLKTFDVYCANVLSHKQHTKIYWGRQYFEAGREPGEKSGSVVLDHWVGTHTFEGTSLQTHHLVFRGRRAFSVLGLADDSVIHATLRITSFLMDEETKS